MAKDNGNSKKMPVSGRFTTGGATGQPKETSTWINGNDLRSGKGGKK